MICNVISAGLIEYQHAWEIQRGLAAARAAGSIPDTLLILEHPHTYTLGSSGHMSNLLISAEECAQRGVAVLQVDRGGDITYHGPGQMVAYPILALGAPDQAGRLPQADYVGYIRRLESVIIETLMPFGIKGVTFPGYTGVWAGPAAVFGGIDTAGTSQKIAAIGVRITSHGISMHGLALNVDPDMDYFNWIIPCGIADKAVASLRTLLGDGCPSMSEVIASFEAAFAHIFERSITHISPETVTRASSSALL